MSEELRKDDEPVKIPDVLPVLPLRADSRFLHSLDQKRLRLPRHSYSLSPQARS